MKKVLFILIAIVASSSIFLSCSEDTQKSYRVTNNNLLISSSIPYFNGSMYEVIVFQYNGNDIIKQDSLGTINYGGGKSKIVNAEDNCNRVRVSFKFLPPESQYYNESTNGRIYTITYYNLKEGETKEIMFDENTLYTTLLKSCVKNSSNIKMLNGYNIQLLENKLIKNTNQ